MWGISCDKDCPSTCHSPGYCNTVTSECLNGCTVGYYGQNCSDICSENCGGEGACERQTGACMSGCKAKWIGKQCLQGTCNLLPGSYILCYYFLVIVNFH